MREEIKRWWDKAKRDFDTAKFLFAGKRYDEASLFCQQAIEKALKTLLLKKNKLIIKTHDLVKLGRLVEIEEELLNSLKNITSVYIESRYPDVSERESSQDETEEDLKLVEKVLKWVEEKI